MLLDFSSLGHYDWLDVPLWVFDPDQQRNLWANAAALRFWHADSAEEFLSRDFSEHGDAVRERLAVTAADHAQGKIVREQWTLYPKGEPTTVMLVSRGMRTPDRRQVMLFAADSLGGGADLAMLRGVEALQHTSVRIAVFGLGRGELLMRNPAAALTFGDEAPAPGQSEFARLFAHAGDAAGILARVKRGEACRQDVELQTLAGTRWHALDARPMRDPVTGETVMLFNARDIADLKASQAALEAAREAAEAASQAK
ncbi:PAS domain-containing protein, partial [Roseateles sp.]|nr:PAS domain-containing protein [Roseateles sp.]